MSESHVNLFADDMVAHHVTERLLIVDGHELLLTHTESNLLAPLSSQPGTVVDYKQLNSGPRPGVVNYYNYARPAAHFRAIRFRAERFLIGASDPNKGIIRNVHKIGFLAVEHWPDNPHITEYAHGKQA